LSEPESHASAASPGIGISRSLPDPNPDPCSNTMKKRRWRARKRGEHVPAGAYYPALTKAGRPRKGTPRPTFPSPDPSSDPIEERQASARQELNQAGTLIEYRHLSFGDVVALFDELLDEPPQKADGPGDQPGPETQDRNSGTCANPLAKEES
jgi:hypothetical protein